MSRATKWHCRDKFNSDTDIAGFQFAVDGVDLTGASGGAAEAEGFTLSTGNNIVVGFSLSGATIPAGEGVLLVLDYDGEGPACLSDLVASDSSGQGLEATVEDCTTISIDTGNDCPSGNYDCAGVCDGDAVEDCAGDCGGSAEVDDCGECGGDNSSCEDCNGVPNGDAVICWDGTCALPDDCPELPSGTVEINLIVILI